MAFQIPSNISITRHRIEQFHLLNYANQNRILGFFNDITIGVGNQSFSANRLVLSCYSDFFQEKFRLKADPPESIKIHDVDQKSFKIIIDYIYTGSITINEQNVFNLLSAAHLLKMDDVKEFCFDYLESAINSNNCIKGINLAILYENDVLLNKYNQYLSKHFNEVSQRIEFKNLSAADLASCISNLNRDEVDEMLLFQAIMAWTKHDQENRLDDFAHLFQLIKLNKVSYDDLMFVVSKEQIIRESNTCLNSILTILPKVLKIKQLKETGSKILSIGGFKTPSKVIQVYSLLDEPAQQYPDLPIKVKNHCSLKLDNFVYCIGGQINDNDDLDVTSKVWKMDLEEKPMKWEQIAEMNQKRWQMAAAIYNGSMVVSNGDDGNNITRTNEVYKLTSKQWTMISPLQQLRNSHAMVSCKGCLWVIGGWYRKKVLSCVERLTDLQSIWEYVAPLQTPRQYLAAVNCRDYIYAIGGESGEDNSTRLKSVEKYDADANKWVYVCNMINERCSHSACVLQDKIYVVGGLNSKGNVVKEIECYDPLKNNWIRVGNTEDALNLHTLVVV